MEEIDFGEDEGFKTPPNKTATPPKNTITPQKTTKYPRRKNGNKEQLIAKTAEELYKHMVNKPNIYNISNSGVIYKDTFQPFDKSDAKESVQVIAKTAAGYSAGTVSPPGTRHLRTKIDKDPEAKAILKKVQTGSGLFSFKPRRWKRKN